jgi:uncharacterized iron-regulated membrane protein
MIRLPRPETKRLVAIHGWAGALLGLLLYAVIVTGTAAVFANEIKAWSGGGFGLAEPFARPINALVDRLRAEVPDELRDDISVRATPFGHLQLFYHTDERVGNEIKTRGILYRVRPDDQITARVEGRIEDLLAAEPETALGRFFVDLHVRLHLPKPYGLVLTGILGLAMLVAAVSGLLMHRHLLVDLFTLRSRGRVVGLRDLHTVAATWTLPHAFVLAFTGAFFSFAVSFGVPILAKIAFAGDMPGLIQAVTGGKPPVDERPAASADLDRIVADSRARADSAIDSMLIEHRGRADARVTVRHLPADGSLRGPIHIYSGATGALLREKPLLGTAPSAGTAMFALMGPLHFGTFAGWPSKAVWFALGTASAYVTWSGLMLWLRRRDERAGWRAFSRAAAWVGGGLPFAMAAAAAAFFLALPSGTTVWWTPAGFLAAAAVTLIPAVLLPTERVAPTLFGASGLVLLSLPIFRLATGGPGWAEALHGSHVVVPAMDVLIVIGGLVCLYCSAATLRRDALAGSRLITTINPAE